MFLKMYQATAPPAKHHSCPICLLFFYRNQPSKSCYSEVWGARNSNFGSYRDVK